jgi:hypothetical protein
MPDRTEYATGIPSWVDLQTSAGAVFGVIKGAPMS